MTDEKFARIEKGKTPEPSQITVLDVLPEDYEEPGDDWIYVAQRQSDGTWEAVELWAFANPTIGRGQTPQEAFAQIVKLMEENGE